MDADFYCVRSCVRCVTFTFYLNDLSCSSTHISGRACVEDRCPDQLLDNSVRLSTCVCVCTKSLQSCPALCDPVDCCLPDSTVHGSLQARIWEWVAIPPGDLSDLCLLSLLHWQADSLPLVPSGKLPIVHYSLPIFCYYLTQLIRKI